MADVLPSFRYHSDPVATGSVVASDDVCVACERARGFVYTGPTYAVDDLTDCLCPWCIADGTAAARFDASFTDIGGGVPDDVPVAVVTEVATRTPGYTAWQQEEWLYHCADACDYRGAVDEGSTMSYRFRCLHCGTALVRSDEP